MRFTLILLAKRTSEMVEIRGVEPLTFSMPFFTDRGLAKHGRAFMGIFGAFRAEGKESKINRHAVLY